MQCIRSWGQHLLGRTGASAVDCGRVLFLPGPWDVLEIKNLSLYQTDIRISPCALAQINLLVLVADKTRISVNSS